MITRKQYMNREFSWREYYGQFSSPNVVASVANYIGPEKLLASTDEHLNDITLRIWDTAPWFGMQREVAIANQSTYSQADRDRNVLATSLSDKVSCLKAAALKWIGENSQMTTYTACFRGRKVGAIGINQWFNVDIEAKDEDEARGKLYDSHEHIFGLFWLWPGKQTVKDLKPNDHHKMINGRKAEVYVSTYNGETWKQTDCCRFDVERVKAEHLADEAFMCRYQKVSA